MTTQTNKNQLLELRDLERARLRSAHRFTVETEDGVFGFSTEAELAEWTEKQQIELPEQPTIDDKLARKREKTARRQERSRRRINRAYMLAHYELRTGRKMPDHWYQGLSEKNIADGIALAQTKHPEWTALRKNEIKNRNA